MQRRVREWRAQYGPDREVYFERAAVPGREAAFDFTDANDLGVTIRGVPFSHLLRECVLSYSKWTYVTLAVSETFEAPGEAELGCGVTCPGTLERVSERMPAMVIETLREQWARWPSWMPRSARSKAGWRYGTGWMRSAGGWLRSPVSAS